VVSGRNVCCWEARPESVLPVHLVPFLLVPFPSVHWFSVVSLRVNIYRCHSSIKLVTDGWRPSVPCLEVFQGLEAWTLAFATTPNWTKITIFRRKSPKSSFPIPATLKNRTKSWNRHQCGLSRPFDPTLCSQSRHLLPLSSSNNPVRQRNDLAAGIARQWSGPNPKRLRPLWRPSIKRLVPVKLLDDRRRAMMSPRNQRHLPDLPNSLIAASPKWKL
jgi:hypothetical protein